MIAHDPLTRLDELAARYDGPRPDGAMLAALHGPKHRIARLRSEALATAHARLAADLRAEIARRRAAGAACLDVLSRRLASERTAAVEWAYSANRAGGTGSAAL